MATARPGPKRTWFPQLTRLARMAVERCVRGTVIRRKLPNGTRFYTTPEAQLKYLWGAFDPELVELGRRHSAAHSVVWDIGANCGVLAFSCTGAREIVAVEPDPFLASLLRRTAQEGGHAVDILEAAVSDHIGEARFSIARRGRASNHLAGFGRSQSGGVRQETLVQTITLDSLIEHRTPPTFIKVDVEGAEALALRGARRLLLEVRPILYVEIGGKARPVCLTLLKDAGYNVVRAARGANFLCTPL